MSKYDKYKKVGDFETLDTAVRVMEEHTNICVMVDTKDGISVFDTLVIKDKPLYPFRNNLFGDYDTTFKYHPSNFDNLEKEFKQKYGLDCNCKEQAKSISKNTNDISYQLKRIADVLEKVDVEGTLKQDIEKINFLATPGDVHGGKLLNKIRKHFGLEPKPE